MFEDPAQRPATGRPARYVTGSGLVVPSVTQVLGLLDKPALVAWAARTALSGTDPMALRDERAAEGSALHEQIRAHFTGEIADVSPFSPRARAGGLVAFLRWRRDWLGAHEVRPVLVEQPLVSERHRFGGTPDLIAEVDGRLEVVDWKTSKRVYREHVLQAVAYAILAREAGYPVEAVRVVHVATEDTGPFGEHVEAGMLGHAQAFMAALHLYRALGTVPEPEAA